MMTSGPDLAIARPWQQIMTGDRDIAVAERDALGTRARVAVYLLDFVILFYNATL